MENAHRFRVDCVIKIMKTKKSHFKDFLRIGKEFWPGSMWFTKKYLNDTFDKKGLYYTAMINGNIVGGIMVVDVDAPKFWIFYFAVDKQYQRIGVGSELVRKVESKIKNGSFLFADIEDIGKTEVNFYKKTGFKFMGKVKHWFENDINAIIMAKKI